MTSHPPPKRRRRAPFVDAATTAPISVEDDAACIRRKLPPVDAAKSPSEGGEIASESSKGMRSVSDSDDITHFIDAPEPTLEEDLPKEVKSQFSMGKLTINGHFQSYVNLPKGLIQ